MIALVAQAEADTNTSTNGGVPAFLAMFLLALAIWALGWSMTRHLRRVSYLERQREQGVGDGATAPDARADREDAPPGSRPGE